MNDSAVQLDRNQNALHQYVELFLERASSVILDKEKELKFALSCLLSGGHLLIEDRPGVGKTTLVKTFSKLMGLDFKRIQFTNDLLPADLTGVSVFDQKTGTFKFHKGPIFTQILLGDELNRATPKTQSACLQAMEEKLVTVDGITYPLPEQFFLIATQNPSEHIGTYNLPESQLDRFTMRINIGLPSKSAERQLLCGESAATKVENLAPVFDSTLLRSTQSLAMKTHASESLIDYLQSILDYSRQISSGLSPRAAISFLRAAKAWAFIDGRDMVVPKDLQDIANEVMAHRITPLDGNLTSEGTVAKIISGTPI